jgi:hypothetical protein
MIPYGENDELIWLHSRPGLHPFALGWLVGFWIGQQFPASHYTWTSSKAYQTGLPSCHMKNGVAKVCYF